VSNACLRSRKKITNNDLCQFYRFIPILLLRVG
jgi:hypothetical protein